MTMREALAQAIDALTERGQPKDLKAIKPLQKRRDNLQAKADTKAAEVADFRDRELKGDAEEIRRIFDGTVCSCGHKKSERTAFCLAKCWLALPPVIRKATHTHSFGDGFEQAYEAGINFLADHNRQAADTHKHF